MTRAGPATKARLLADLRSLGIRGGDVVMVHASLRAVGPVEGGPAILAEALRDAVGVGGTLVAYASWDHSPYDATLGGRRLSAEDERNWPVLTQNSAPFPGFGRLNHYLLDLDGARRSMHPDASILAVGAMASEITRSHPLGSGYGPGSPLGRFLALDGQVLLLGAPPGSVTVLHYAEAVARIPGKRTVRYRVPDPFGPQGSDWVDVVEDDSNGILDAFAGDAAVDPVETICRAYLDCALHREAYVGQALCRLFSARDIVRFGIDWLEQRFSSAALSTGPD